MGSVVVDPLLGHLHLVVQTVRVAGVEVAVKAREIAAGDLQPDAVPGPEEIAGLPQLDPIDVHLIWFDGTGVLVGVAEAGPHNALAQVDGLAPGVHVD